MAPAVVTQVRDLYRRLHICPKFVYDDGCEYSTAKSASEFENTRGDYYMGSQIETTAVGFVSSDYLFLLCPWDE